MTGNGLTRIGGVFSKVARQGACGFLYVLVGAVGGCVPEHPPPEGFLPENATIRIVNPAQVPESSWTQQRLEYSYSDGEETTEALQHFIASAEHRGALAISRVEIHTRQRRDGKVTVCVTHVDPVLREHKTAKTEKRPGLPPTTETVIVTEKRWEIDQTRSDCHPSQEPLDEQTPHVIVGLIHRPR